MCHRRWCNVVEQGEKVRLTAISRQEMVGVAPFGGQEPTATPWQTEMGQLRRSSASAPNCGCEDSALLRRTKWWGKGHDTRRCNHCGRRFQAAATEEPKAEQPSRPEDRGVVYRVIACPRCGSRKTKVTSTRRPRRHHKCLDCRYAFQSCEK